MTERELSYDILYDIHINGELSHLALKKALDDCDKSGKTINKGFVTNLVNGVTERYLTLLFLISKQAGRPVGKIKPAIRLMLSMGIYQAYYMSVPESAAVNETVKLAVKRGFSGLKGFVNGVLRGLLRTVDNVDEFIDRELSKESVEKRLSIKYSCPEWMVNHYIAECGEEKTERLLAAGFDKMKLTVYGMRSACSEEELMSDFEADGVSVTKICGIYSAYEINTGLPLTALKAYKKGAIIVQDVSSMLATEVLPKPGAVKVLDICAAPGGKALHLADKLSFSGGELIARDLTADKTAKIDESIKRTKLKNIMTEVGDALVFNSKDVLKYDLVVADLPCSGLGVIGRKPDIKYKTKPEDIVTLAEVQRNILKNATEYVKYGGYLAYSTCTVAKAENDDNAEFIVGSGFEPVSIVERLPEGFKEYLKADNVLQLLPDKDHDGFYIALYRKVKND